MDFVNYRIRCICCGEVVESKDAISAERALVKHLDEKHDPRLAIDMNDLELDMEDVLR